MASTDTTADARVVQLQVFAAMSGPERVSIAVEMAELAKAISLSGLRLRHPGLDEPAIHLEWLRLCHGDEIAEYARSAGHAVP